MNKLALAALIIVTSLAEVFAAAPAVDKKYRPIPWDPAPLPEVAVRAERPRIWFTRAQVPELRKRCQTSCREAFAGVQAHLAETKEPRLMAFDLAFLYQMTDDSAYARGAIEIARKARPFQWIERKTGSEKDGFPMIGPWYAKQADPLACVFDWCYDQLTADDKWSIGEVLRTQLALGPYRMVFHEGWWYCCWLSEILALSGSGIDDKLAEEQLAQFNRVMHQYIAVADEIMADSAYGDYQTAFTYHWPPPEMWLQGTGENLFRKCGWLGKQPDYFLYLLLPAGHYLCNDGDGPTDLLGGLGDAFLPPRSTFAFYGLRNDNPFARWLARNWSGKAARTRGGGSPWEAIVWADSGNEERPVSELPPVKLFPSNGVAVLRSGWDLGKKSTDTVAAFYCRPIGGHAHYDVGHFVVWRGLDQLVQRNGFYTNPGWEYHRNFFGRTIAHNCLTIRDPQETAACGGQARDGGQLDGAREHYPAAQRLLTGVGPWSYRGEIRTFVDRPQETYLFADLTPAYAATKASRVTRAFLWLKPATFLVCDWATSTRPDFTKRWLLNVATRPEIDGQERVVAGSHEAGILESSDTHRLTVTRGVSKLFVHPLLPEQRLVRCLGGEGYGSWSDGKDWQPPAIKEGFKVALQEQAKHFWRIEIEPVRAATDDVFLTLLDTAEAGTASAPTRATVKREAAAVGAEIHGRGASKVVLFYPDGRLRIDGEEVGQALTPLKPCEGR